MNGVADVQANWVITILGSFSLVAIPSIIERQVKDMFPCPPTKHTPVSSMMSQLPVPWAFFSALCILGVDEVMLEQRIQLTI